MALFILIRRRGSKKDFGVFPARKGLTRSTLLKNARRQVRAGFLVVGVFTLAEVRRRLLRQLKRPVRREKVKRKARRKVRRKKVRKRKK